MRCDPGVPGTLVEDWADAGWAFHKCGKKSRSERGLPFSRVRGGVTDKGEPLAGRPRF